MALSAEDFMKGTPADHLDANAFMGGEEVPQTSKKKPTSISDGISDIIHNDQFTGQEREWGLSPQSQKELGIFGAKYGPLDVGARVLTGLQVATELGAAGLEGAWQGLTPEGPTGDLTRSIHPGQGLMALTEAFPLGGLETGIVPHPVRFNNEKELLARGSTEDIIEAASQTGLKVNPEEVANYVKTRDAGGEVGGAVYKQSDLPMEEQGNLPFNRATPAEAKLQLEADAFMAGKPVEPELDYRQRDLPLETPPQQLGLDLQHADASRLPEPVAPVKPEAPATVPENVQAVVDHVNDAAKDWKNAPEIEVHPSFDDLDGVDSNALGVYDAETGQIKLNTKAIEEEAASRGLTNQQMTNTVLFHEGLGHFGLTQKFRTGLDNTLTNFYKNSPEFKRDVDGWLKANPKAYTDDFNRTARAAEEVLAEKSETGAIPLTLTNQVKNYVKATARKMGIKLDYSNREIETILAQAHKAVIKGENVGAEGNGLRYSANRTLTVDDPDVQAVAHQYGYDSARTAKALNEVDFRYAVDQTRRERLGLESDGIKIETPQDDIDWVEKTRALNQSKATPFKEVSENADGTKFLEYKSKSGDTIPIKMAIDNGTAEIAIDQFSNRANRLGPGELRQAMLKLAEAYPEIEQFGGYRRSGAGAGRVQEISLRQQKVMNSVNRYMMRRSGTGSEGTLQKDATLGPIRTNRVVEEALKDFAPNRTKESWDEWITDAGHIKLSSKAAQSLATGTEVPELLAAREFAARSTNRIIDLTRKSADQTLSPREQFSLGQEQERLANIMQSVNDVKANAARILNSSKIEVGTDKAINDSVRLMAASADLSTPIGRQEFLAAVDQAKVAADKRAKIDQALSYAGDILNLPRTIMSSVDLSAPLRQGVFLVGRKELWKNFLPMFKAFGSQKAYDAIMADIASRPNYSLMKKSNLGLTDLGTDITKREEAFVSRFAGKMPLIKHSERAYNGFLNKTRADVFDSLVDLSNKAGVDLQADPKALRDISRFVNSATGRGDLGQWSQAATALSNIFFSPRLMASRLNLLNPKFYTDLSPVVRKEAIKSAIAFGGIAMIVATLFSMAGADVETDPRSSDFAKIKTGNTRYDILGGFGQYVTLGARLATNEKKNAKGKVEELGKKYGQQTRLDVATSFGINKFSPVASFVADYLRGKNAIGEPFDARKKAVESFIPLFLQDAADVVKEEGLAKGAAMSVPGIFGVGIQTYDANAPKQISQIQPVSAAQPIEQETPTISAEEFMKGQDVK